MISIESFQHGDVIRNVTSREIYIVHITYFPNYVIAVKTISIISLSTIEKVFISDLKEIQVNKFEEVQIGNIIQIDGNWYIVSYVFDGRITAVRTITVTNPCEWEKIND